MAQRLTDTLYTIETADSTSGTLDGLYSDYRERLVRFVTPKVGGDSNAAEDIVQEAFAAAIVSLAGFGARSSPYTWLCSIAQHKVADYYRKRSPSDIETSTIDPDMCTDSSEDDTSSSVEQWFEALETRDMVQHAIERLPYPYGVVLRLKYFDGLSVAEIGKELGRTSKAIEGLLARARQALCRDLSELAPA
jgi:RNA polymerase sigma-70 factor (ECF subfamily)